MHYVHESKKELDEVNDIEQMGSGWSIQALKVQNKFVALLGWGARKNPGSERWNDEVKTTVGIRKKLTMNVFGTKEEIVIERCMEILNRKK